MKSNPDRHKLYRSLLALCLSVIFIFGCSLATRASQVKSTLVAIDTQVQSGRQVFGTGEAIVTQVGSQLIDTAQAVGTQVEQSGLPQTAQAVATQVVESGLPQTAQAMITQANGVNVPGTALAVITKVNNENLPATAEAEVTQANLGGLPATAEAFVTEVYTSPDQVPQDIPIMEGDRSAFIGSPGAISYFIKADFSAVLKYYQQEMLARGWTKIDYGTTVTDTTAELHYQKANRKATIILTAVPFLNQTTVVINLE